MSIRELIQKRDENDNLIESRLEYLARLQTILPNWPNDALEQFFIDHSDSDHIEGWQWIGLGTVGFEEQFWDTNSFASDRLRDDGGIADWVNRYLPQNETVGRFRSIETYFRKNGTWPRPVMFLENAEDRLRDRIGRPVGSPWHLVEGHHRLAMLIFLRSRIRLAPKHRVWVMSIPKKPS